MLADLYRVEADIGSVWLGEVRIEVARIVRDLRAQPLGAGKGLVGSLQLDLGEDQAGVGAEELQRRNSRQAARAGQACSCAATPPPLPRLAACRTAAIRSRAASSGQVGPREALVLAGW